ncbi:acyltransferase family protein [Ciceribacter ferrooxidans]|uniref:Acyltransferase n=1 Tax=Ciceribacter ferrooxidans TaxID=2509717 RepID=A0A4Q2SVC2_9HYPH|nr:acyltransferase [Ciceribacter ferrooxidans]RYC10016.1 acyltransferase [Ciceribacter ferrooxidans]
MNTLYGIQYLRAAAAIAVVLFHAAEKLGYSFAIGAVGVDVFFVVSGFIMWVITERRTPTPAGFLRGRIRRIVPVYWMATAVMIAGGLAGLFPNLRLSIGHVMASFLFVPARSPSNGEIWPVLVQGWTLNYEMFFYVVFAVALFLPRQWRFLAIGLLFAALVAAGQIFESDNVFLVTYTRPIILEFVAGMAIGMLWLNRRMPGRLTGVLLIAAGLGGFAVIHLLGLPFDAWDCGPLATALVLGVVSLEANGGIARAALPAFLGDASYSIYLWHTFAISVTAKVGMAAGIPMPALMVSAVAAGILAGAIGYTAFERPTTRLWRQPAW